VTLTKRSRSASRASGAWATTTPIDEQRDNQSYHRRESRTHRSLKPPIHVNKDDIQHCRAEESAQERRDRDENTDRERKNQHSCPLA
jgi:hypothetical protein